jgi:hypothetical protein
MLELFGDEDALAQGTSKSAHERRNRLQREHRNRLQRERCAKQREQPSFHNDVLQFLGDGDALAQGTLESAHERRNRLQKERRNHL